MGIEMVNYQEIPIYRAVSLLIGVLIIEVSIIKVPLIEVSLIVVLIILKNLYRENLYREKEPITCLRERMKRRRASRYLSW